MPENVNTSALTLSDAKETVSLSDVPSMIKVDHVSMVFNMASEQLNSLKEYAIKIARRELFFEGFTALDDISLDVKKGDVYGIMGTNGSGKSTLLKIIAGVLEPTSGSCEINGNIAPLIELGAGFDAELSARENIYLNGALLGYSKTFIQEHFDEIVAFAEIEKFLDMPLKNYSSGMVARIAFAIATVIIPEILVVDEVLSVGDFMFQKKCEDRINELIDKHGVTVLIVSHSNSQIERLCNKAIWIEKGHTRLIGSASSVCRVYGGLGGRVGSPESENRVFDALNRVEETLVPSEMISRVYGENSYSTNARLVLRGWKSKAIDTVVLTSGATHINSIIANPLAGALGAVVLPVKPEGLSDAIERLLYDYKPAKIFIVDYDGSASDAFRQVGTLPWQPVVTTFQQGGNLWDVSVDVFRYGIVNNLWSHEATLIDFENNPESLIAAAYLYDAKAPVLALSSMGQSNLDEAIRLFKDAKTETLFAFGESSQNSIDDQIEQMGFCVTRIGGGDTNKSCIDVSAWVYDYFLKHSANRTEICVASIALGQWPELLSCGCYVAEQASCLLLQDSTSLDSVSACLDFVSCRADKLGSITSIGDQLGLSEDSLKLLAGEMLHSHSV